MSLTCHFRRPNAPLQRKKRFNDLESLWTDEWIDQHDDRGTDQHADGGTDQHTDGGTDQHADGATDQPNRFKILFVAPAQSSSIAIGSLYTLRNG